ncbi:unnamed protein product [Camellia sinensis]
MEPQAVNTSMEKDGTKGSNRHARRYTSPAEVFITSQTMRYEEAKQAFDHLGWGTSCFLLVGDTTYNGNQLESVFSWGIQECQQVDPIRSAIIDSCIRVTDNGRESIQRKVFFIFTLYNTSNHNDQLKLGASSPEEAALHVHNFQEAALKVSSARLLIWCRIAMLKRLTNDYVHMQADQNPGDVGSPRSDWQSLRNWKMVPGLKTGRLRKKTLTQPETDSLAAIPLGSPVAPSPLLPVQSNVGPSHHVTSQPMVDSDETQAPSETQPSGVDFEAPTCTRTDTWQRHTKIIRAKKGENVMFTSIGG